MSGKSAASKPAAATKGAAAPAPAKPAAGAAHAHPPAKPLSPTEALREAANAKYKAGDYAGAVEAYTEALAAAPTSVLHTNRAAARFMLRQYAEALEDCATAVELDPKNVKAYIRGAKAHMATGDFDPALALLQRGALIDPRDEAVLAERKAAGAAARRLDLARACLAAKEYDRALAAFAGLAADPCPASYDVHSGRAEALAGLGRLDEALAVTTELMTGRSARADTGASAAADADAAAASSGPPRKAGAAPAQALSAASASRGSGDGRLLLLRARILNLQGAGASAIKHLQELMRMDPDHPAAARMLRALRRQEALKAAGNEAFKAAKWQAAADAYTECMALCSEGETAAALGENPGFVAKLFCNRAAAWAKLSEHDEAYADCSRCIELDEGYSKAYIRRAQAGVALGDMEHVETAVRDYGRAKELLAAEAKRVGGSGAGVDQELARELDRGLREAREALKKAKRKDYYKLLGVAKDADDETIKKAYKKQAMRFHPDRNVGATPEELAKAEGLFKDCGEALAVLTDATKRRQYDSGANFNSSGEIDVTEEDHGGMGHGGMGGMRGGGGGGMPVGVPMDLFEMLFSGMAGGGGPRAAGGAGGGGVFRMPTGGGGPRAR